MTPYSLLEIRAQIILIFHCLFLGQSEEGGNLTLETFGVKFDENVWPEVKNSEFPQKKDENVSNENNLSEAKRQEILFKFAAFNADAYAKFLQKQQQELMAKLFD